ncbi:hypothetical protein M758_1G298900 [Ceratodon purpureus]|nr:hypothetical protein M758_1G298900 [Ceratodon purpureus]
MFLPKILLNTCMYNACWNCCYALVHFNYLGVYKSLINEVIDLLLLCIISNISIFLHAHASELTKSQGTDFCRTGLSNFITDSNEGCQTSWHLMQPVDGLINDETDQIKISSRFLD